MSVASVAPKLIAKIYIYFLIKNCQSDLFELFTFLWPVYLIHISGFIVHDSSVHAFQRKTILTIKL